MSWGLLPEDFAADLEYEIVDENLDSVNFFSRILTQWRMNGNRAYGFDYNTFDFIFRMMNITDIERQRIIFDDIRIMEPIAINTMMES